ncbi:uncharacterized protein LOC110984103 [Acanthaster planci]|uniref:malate synthase n=1 Tax=Acanthaster planci TaxID=133434 RepID=A0A8B7Z1Y2_ACAPL|nr:uncharacterized protein LOC110984103 [Acanthaster planci]
MEPGQETQETPSSVESVVNPSSIAYTVEIHLVEEDYACTNQPNVADQHLAMVGDEETQEQPTVVPIEVISEGRDDMGVQPETMTTEQIEPNMMVTFTESDPPTNIHHLTVSSDMMAYLPEPGLPPTEDAAGKPHHQIIMTQHPTSGDLTEVKLVDSMPADSSQDMSVLLVQPNEQESKPTEDAADSQQGVETIKEMEIASAVEALEALTGLATTFNAWAQQNPQALEESGHPTSGKPHKSEKHKSGKHKSKKHKSGKHKKRSSHYKEAKSSIDTGIDQITSSEDGYKCKTCGKIFGTRLKLRNHMISHSDKRPHVCLVCGSAFKRARYLQIHKKSHFSDKLFACTYCQKTYFERKRLRSHMKCHINPLKCEVCGKTYGDKRGLEIHFRTHTNEKPFLCRICGRGFTSKAGVNKHERSHSGLKPYVCKTCGKAYTQPTNLSDHERTHINDKTFACTSCSKVFLARSSLRRHRIKNHPGEEPNVGKLEPLHQRMHVIKRVNLKDDKWHYKYSCATCDKKFKKEKYLKKHSKIHSAGTKGCSYCNKSFRDKRDLQNHERRHTGEKPYKCSKCGKAFVSSSAMLRHEKCHLGLKPYVCTTCGKAFTRTTGLRDHELIHKGKNKRFPCHDCDKIFASRSALRSHGRLKHQFVEIVDAPMATMEVPVETDEGDAVSYIKLMFTEKESFQREVFLVMEVHISCPPTGLEEAYNTLLTPGALAFIGDIAAEFDSRVEQMLNDRILKKAHLDQSRSLPDFSPETSGIRTGSWKVDPVPRRLKNRHVDLGDVSPANTGHFVQALQSSAQGIQTDFDDGHCPTWQTQLQGMYNIYQAVHGKLYADMPSIDNLPVLMLRPRAWNMVEHNMLVKGKEVPGPIFDFGLLMFHTSKILCAKESGPYFYLSKLEGYKEARLWKDIFAFVEEKLGLRTGTIKATVLIENVFAAFEMHEILHELRYHSAGLNCGIWDYSASFINKLGNRPEFVLPDRSKYVNMQRHFLNSYMTLTIQTCHGRGCHATGGMSATLLPAMQGAEYDKLMDLACRAKLAEIKAGVDGFMVYDIRLVKPMQQLFEMYAPSANQHAVLRPDVNVTKEDLLLMPSGGVTFGGLKHNIAVAVLFIESWLKGQGHFYYKGAIEDSATAEISRSQVWQWIHHRARLEDNNELITYTLVNDLCSRFVDAQMQDNPKYGTTEQSKCLLVAADIFRQLITETVFPEFLTTYLSLENRFRTSAWHDAKF